MITLVIRSYFKAQLNKARVGWCRFTHPSQSQSFVPSPTQIEKELLSHEQMVSLFPCYHGDETKLECDRAMGERKRFMPTPETPLKQIFAQISEKDLLWCERSVLFTGLLLTIVLMSMPACVSVKESRRRAEIRYWDGVLDGLSGTGLKPK